MTVASAPLEGHVYRAHNPRWSFAPDSGAGAAQYGGRFNPVGLPALYASLRPETAWLEAQQAFPLKPQPVTICAYAVTCRAVIDLTEPRNREHLDITWDELACPWELLLDRGTTPPTWPLVARLREKGWQAAKVPSFAPGADGDDINVVFWDWSVQGPCAVRVIDDWGRLPRDAASWS